MAKHAPVIEAKVKVSSAVAAATGLVLALLAQYVFGGGEVPDLVEGIVEPLVATLVSGGLTFAGGWLTKHTPRGVVDIRVEE